MITVCRRPQADFFARIMRGTAPSAANLDQTSKIPNQPPVYCSGDVGAKSALHQRGSRLVTTVMRFPPCSIIKYAGAIDRDSGCRSLLDANLKLLAGVTFRIELGAVGVVDVATVGM